MRSEEPGNNWSKKQNFQKKVFDYMREWTSRTTHKGIRAADLLIMEKSEMIHWYRIIFKVQIIDQWTNNDTIRNLLRQPVHSNWETVLKNAVHKFHWCNILKNIYCTWHWGRKIMAKPAYGGEVWEPQRAVSSVDTGRLPMRVWPQNRIGRLFLFFQKKNPLFLSMGSF